MKRAGVRIVVDPSVEVSNDRTVTGLRLVYPVRPRNLVDVLTNRKSWLRVTDNVTFWLAHRDELTWSQLARRYDAIPYGIADEVLERTHLKEPARRVLRRVRAAR